MGVEVTGGGGGALAAAGRVLTRVGHLRHGVSADLANDYNMGQTGALFTGAPFVVGGTTLTRTVTDQRRCWTQTPTLAAGSELTYHMATPGQVVGALFRDVVGAILTPGQFLDVPLATVCQAWLRKLNNVNITSARQFFGFANTGAGVDTTQLGISAAVPRVGLMGDGAVGFRLGSVNCPDGAAAGQNAFGEIDAGFAQPAGLVNPGLGWFHVRVKMVPPTPSTPAVIGYYFNGGLVLTHTALANFPRGRGAVNTGFRILQARLVADFDAGTQLNGWNMTEFEHFYDTDLSL